MHASDPSVQTLDVETPELVVFSYTLAGTGSRAAAALADYLICAVGLVVMALAIGVFGSFSRFTAWHEITGAWVLAAIVLAQFAVLWGYYVLFEALADGQTPGKRWQHLRVVRDGGYSITFGASAVRNLVRLVDMQPAFLYAVGLLGTVVSKHGKRLGDMAAGTLVVREESAAPARAAAVAAADASATAAPRSPVPAQTLLTDAEFAVLDLFVHRNRDLDAARRAEMARQLTVRFAAAIERSHPGPPAATDTARLMQLRDAEQRSRAQGAAGHRQVGASRERHAIVAAGSPRWAAFAQRLHDARRGGLASLGEVSVREFVRQYRDLTADLAKLQTAAKGSDAQELFYLNRLVAGAHNLLYRRRALSWRVALEYLFDEVPREIRASARPIALAAALLFGPAVVAYTAVVRDPALAERFVPPHMLDRADDGVQRAAHGEGYIDDPELFRPLMATSIVTNNVQVAIGAFAFGMTAGTLTTWILLTNGVHLGAVSGLYASKGIGGLLLAFVAPHGVLELSAICIAGGAGFLLAAALLIPGERTRRSAMVENGRRAIRLVAGATTLLVVAGAIEGFLSPIPWWPIEGKLAVSAVTAVGLLMFVRPWATTCTERRRDQLTAVS